MTPQEFCYWLQGFVEISGGSPGMTPEQVKVVKDHLALVFTKVTPNVWPNPNPIYPPLQHLDWSQPPAFHPINPSFPYPGDRPEDFKIIC